MFERAFDILMDIEGYYSNDPQDLGGETKFGVTYHLARAYGYKNLDDFTAKDARKVLKAEFWDKNNLDLIKHEVIAVKVFCFAVHSGSYNAVKTLQRCYNRLYYQDIAVDGVIGSQTASAINKIADPMVFLHEYILEQIDFYRKICNQRPSQRKFLRGWLNRAYRVLEIYYNDGYFK
jgi:lysozyme family protein